MRVLLIDDTKEIIEMISEYLKLKNVECEGTEDPKKGIEMIRNQRFDAIVLDMAMPEFSGWDVIELLESEDLLKNQKIILYTASSVADKEIQKLLEKEGVHSCIRKPGKLTDLLEAIKS